MGKWSDGKKVKEILTKKDFGTWFDATKTLEPLPEPPGGLLLGGYPELQFLATADRPIDIETIFVSNFWKDPVRVLSARIEGGDNSFQFRGGQVFVGNSICFNEIPGGWGYICPSTIEFSPKSSGVFEAQLIIEYQVASQLKRVRRLLKGRAQ